MDHPGEIPALSHLDIMKIADMFAAQLSQLQRESETSERKTAAALARAKALISDLEEMERRWTREDATL